MKKQKVCVVLPCYRVKNKILLVYKKLYKLQIDSLIFVDDKCPQESLLYLKSKIRKNKRTKFIFLKNNLGVGGATLAGFKFALKRKYDIVIKFDADDQHKTSDLIKIIKKLKNKNIDFCKGFRNLNLKASLKRNMPLLRIFGANGLTFLSNLTTRNFHIKDVTNGLFGLKVQAFKKVNLKNLKQNYFFEQDLIFRLSKAKIKIHQVKSEVIYSDELSSLSAFRSILPFLFFHVQNFFYRYKN